MKKNKNLITIIETTVAATSLAMCAVVIAHNQNNKINTIKKNVINDCITVDQTYNYWRLRESSEKKCLCYWNGIRNNFTKSQIIKIDNYEITDDDRETLRIISEDCEDEL